MNSRLILLLLVLLAVSPSCKRSTAVLEEEPHDNLVQRVRDAMLALDPGVVISIDDNSTLIVTLDGGEQGLISVDNVRLDCEAYPEGCEDAIQHYAASIIDSLENLNNTPDFDPSRIRIVLKDQAYIDMLREPADSRLGGQEPMPQVVWEHFHAGIWMVYVEDFPTTMTLLTTDRLQEGGLTAAQVHDLAVQNMTRDLVANPLIERQIDGVLRGGMVSAGDSYEAARLVLAEPWTSLAPRLDGDLVVCAGSRDSVTFAGSNDATEIEAMRTECRLTYQTAPYPVSPDLLRWTGSGWETFTN